MNAKNCRNSNVTWRGKGSEDMTRVRTVFRPRGDAWRGTVQTLLAGSVDTERLDENDIHHERATAQKKSV